MMGICFRNVMITRGAVQWLILGVVINTLLPVCTGFNKQLLQSAGLSMFTNHHLLLFEIYKSHVEISTNVSRLRSFVSMQLFFLCIPIQESASSGCLVGEHLAS